MGGKWLLTPAMSRYEKEFPKHLRTQMEGKQFSSQLPSNCFDLILDLFWVHADNITTLSAFVNKKMISLRKKLRVITGLIFPRRSHSL
jgi:hypothetical protein